MSKENETIKEKESSSKNYSSLIVEYPKEVTIQLVQANDLKFYEVFHWLLTIFSPAAIGFWVGYFSVPKEDRSDILLIVSIVFTIFTSLFIVLTIYFRLKLYKKQLNKTVSKTILELK